MRIESPNAYLTDKELETKYRKLAKMADARIARIEAKIGQAKFKGIENYAYKAAKKMISPIIGLSDGRPRFDRSIKNLSRGQKEAMVGHVEQFVDFDTSTLRGYNKVWAERTASFNKTFSNEDHTINVSVEEYRYLWESEKFNEMEEEYGYRDAFDSVMLNLQDGLNMKDAIELAAFKKGLKSAFEDINKAIDNDKKELNSQYNKLFGRDLDTDLRVSEDFNLDLLAVLRKMPQDVRDKILNNMPDKLLLQLGGEVLNLMKESAPAALEKALKEPKK